MRLPFRLGCLALAMMLLPDTEAAASGASKGDRSARRGMHYVPMGYQELTGWERDDHLAALQTFIASCDRLQTLSKERLTGGRPPPSPRLLEACVAAKRLPARVDRAGAKDFFETHFSPHMVVHKGRPGLLTAYYEPVLHGSRTPEGAYTTPIYKRPPDLVTLVDEMKGGRSGTVTHARRTARGTEPFFTRAEIEQGALKGRGLELLYFAEPVEVFFMHIQGSARVRLTDGTTTRVQYDGKNGHQYASIGQYLIDQGLLAADKVSLAALKAWLQSDRERGQKVMWHNRSFVFFREVADDGGEKGPPGALGVPLTPMRSLAVDPAYHALGTPIFVTADGMSHVEKSGRFEKLMIAQDVGSAIKGPERGDLYFGSGDGAAKIAGVTKVKGSFVVLLPNEPVPTAEAGRPKP
ncbi:MAG: MltA domain-containing protein [Hyphomicrobiaceae bacterium]|nr:MltA domain-containing protein [Hyphomicrobiaceae bacterium]